MQYKSSRTLNDVRDLIALIVFTNKNCKYVFAVIYDGVWEEKHRVYIWRRKFVKTEF